MSKNQKQGLFIGRFQPFHDGHLYAVKVAASQVNKLKILVGSANACRSIKNPWTYQERVDIIRKKLWQEGVNNVQFYPVNDYPYNDYLKWFPMFNFQSIPSGAHGINATSIREELFKVRHPDIPKTVQADWDYYNGEAQKFSNYPYPETLNFNCADAVVTCLGHVLLIERKNTPGMGTWALPGGFKNRNETFQQCAIRELREETNLRVPEKVLIGSIKSFKMFDSPSRSFGISRNTMAYHFDIAPDANGVLPRANGSDDANEAKWIPMNEAMLMSLYDDHLAIINELTGIYPDFAFLTS